MRAEEAVAYLEEQFPVAITDRDVATQVLLTAYDAKEKLVKAVLRWDANGAQAIDNGRFALSIAVEEYRAALSSTASPTPVLTEEQPLRHVANALQPEQSLDPESARILADGIADMSLYDSSSTPPARDA